MQLILSAFTVLNVYLTYVAFVRIRKSKRVIQHIWTWASLFGAFVWEDLFLICAFNALVVLFTLVVNDLRYGLLFFCLFWIVRSSGEARYFMLQQFIEPKHPPLEIDAHFDGIRRVFGNISAHQGFILMQVFQQLILITMLFLGINLLLYWNAIPAQIF